jgi:hypothetical protein
MVSIAERKMMMEFVAERIDASARYDIQNANAGKIIISQKKALVEKPVNAHIFLHSAKIPLKEYKLQVRGIINNGEFVGNVFYKDNQTFMVRLAERGNFKGDDRSLKNYSKEDIDKMVHLRGIEKTVLELQKVNQLAYFQPETARLSESIRVYMMLPVNLDYSHIGIEDRSYDFVQNRESIDYKIAEEQFSFSEKGLSFSRSSDKSQVCIVRLPE